MGNFENVIVYCQKNMRKMHINGNCNKSVGGVSSLIINSNMWNMDNVVVFLITRLRKIHINSDGNGRVGDYLDGGFLSLYLFSII